MENNKRNGSVFVQVWKVMKAGMKLTHVGTRLASGSNAIAPRLAVSAGKTGERNAGALDRRAGSGGFELRNMSQVSWRHVVADNIRHA